MKRKDLEYYKSLNYDIIIRKIDDYEEPFYQAFTKELNPIAFYGTGNTPEKAIRCFEETKIALFEDHIENGLRIPEPEVPDDEAPSGRFLIRTSPEIHRKLTKLAEKNNQSLNAYINGIFAQFSTAQEIVNFAKMIIRSTITMEMDRHLMEHYRLVRGGVNFIQEIPEENEVIAA